MAASAKRTSNAKSRKRVEGDSKAILTTKSTTTPRQRTRINQVSGGPTADKTPGSPKETNSGGTRRTASHQAEPTKNKQAKEASDQIAKMSRRKSKT